MGLAKAKAKARDPLKVETTYENQALDVLN
jgi:hypothetical protein